MNDSRKQRLERASSLIGETIGIISEVREEEQELFYNLPENLKESEKGEATGTTINTLLDAENNLQEALSGIDDALT